MTYRKKIEKLGIEFHPFSLSKRKRYQYLGPGTFLKKRLARGDPGINRLDRIAKQHDIDYSNAKNIRDKWKADLKMVHAKYVKGGPYSYTFRINKIISTNGERKKERSNFYGIFIQNLLISTVFIAILKMELPQCNKLAMEKLSRNIIAAKRKFKL